MNIMRRTVDARVTVRWRTSRTLVADTRESDRHNCSYPRDSGILCMSRRCRFTTSQMTQPICLQRRANNALEFERTTEAHKTDDLERCENGSVRLFGSDLK